MQAVRAFNEGKFRELLVYISGRCGDHPHFDATKLNKILFYADFVAYERLGVPMTGADYLALESGPAPEQLNRVQGAMIHDGDLAIFQNGIKPGRVVALRPPRLEEVSFSASEIAIVDEVIERLKDHTAGSASAMLPGFLGWKAARAESAATKKLSIIPYETVFVDDTPLDRFEEEIIRPVAKTRGLSL